MATLREELAKIAKPFFKINSDLQNIFVTEDKHCWYTEIEAIRFCKGAKKYEGFVRSDFEKKQVKKTSRKSKED
jgi:hypothetical protein